MEQKARCVHCRSEVMVPASYADGDHIKCPSCETRHRLVRTAEGVRLVIADIGPLQDQLHMNEQRQRRLQAELAEAYASWGIGVNGFLVGLLYIVSKVALEDQIVDRAMLIYAAAISVVVGILLELANYLFLAKRKAISRLMADIAELQAESKEAQRKIRDAVARR